MGRPYSIDLRERAVAAVEKGGMSRRRAAAQFGVGVSTVIAWVRFQPGVGTITANNAFFQNLGTNGRTCFSCHQPQNGWTVSAADVRARFEESSGTDPIFRLVDGATCPTDDVSTLSAKTSAGFRIRHFF